MALFQTRLGSVATAGLNIPNIQAEYICHYKGGLIGKHFKTLAQVMSFLIFDLVPRDVLQAWLVIGRLIVIAWRTDIDDIDAYTVCAISLLQELVVTKQFRTNFQCAFKTFSTSHVNAAQVFLFRSRNSTSSSICQCTSNVLDQQYFFQQNVMNCLTLSSVSALSIATISRQVVILLGRLPVWTHWLNTL